MRLFLALILIGVVGCTKGAPEADATEKPITIVVLDTGFGFNNQGHDAKLCKYGHKDFSADRQFTKDYGTVDPVPLDVHGHGTNVVGLIERSLKKTDNYCLVIVKYYAEGQTGSQNLGGTIRAFRYAANIKAKVLNYSGGGPEYDYYEDLAVKAFLNQGGTVIAAAGNEHSDIDKQENKFFPAEYDTRIVVVGNVDEKGVRVPSSNFGKVVTRTENGLNQEVYGIKMTGTSQATAIATGKIVSEMKNVRK